MKVGLIGDSHTQVTFDLLIPLLESMGQQVVGRVSKPGWGIKSFNNDPDKIAPVIQNDPDIIIVSIGGNNFQLDGAKYGAEASEFLQRLGYPKRKIVWLGPLYATRSDVDKRHRWTNDWLIKNLPRKINYVDLYPFSASGHSSDGVHFTRSAYNQIVSSIEPKIDQALGRYQIAKVAKITLPIALLLALGVYFRSRR
jgi:hypothetical protein